MQAKERTPPLVNITKQKNLSAKKFSTPLIHRMWITHPKTCGKLILTTKIPCG